MQRERIIREMERMGARVECSCNLGGLLVTYAGYEVDVQIGSYAIPTKKGRKFARLDSAQDARGLINSIEEHA